MSALGERGIRRIVRTWQTRLNLDHWEIAIRFDEPPEDKDVVASMFVPWDYDRGELRFHPSCLTKERDEWGIHYPMSADHVVVHELLHLHFRGLDWASMKLFENHLHRDSESLLDRAYKHEQEATIERVAKAIVAGMPPA